MGYKPYLDEEKIKMIEWNITYVNRNHNKVEITTYMNEIEEHFLYVLQEHISLCQGKGLINPIYNPDNFYRSFRNLLK